jgi:hypothetical protein
MKMIHQNKKFKRTILKCKRCSCLFERFNCHLKKSKNFFCSIICRNLFSLKQLECNSCRKLFNIKKGEKTKRELQGSKLSFCSRVCMHNYKESLKLLSTCPMCKNSFLQTEWQKKNYRFCSPECKSKEDQKREKGRNYRNGAAIYRVISREVYGDICYSCKGTKNIEVHHLDKNKKNNIKENLRPLCRDCHHAVHKNRLCLVL